MSNAKLQHPLFGLDSTGEVSAAAHHAVGSSVALRYLSRYTAKVPGAREVADYRNGGIHLVFVFEDGAKNALMGRSQGVSDATFARAQARALGMPINRPIYFAVDFDTAGNPSVTDAYFDGVAEVLGRTMCGPYGSAEVCAHHLNRGFGFAWQTYAWSRNFFDGRCQVYQYSNGHTVGGVGVDFNHIYYEDFGQIDFHFVPPPPPDPNHYLWYPNVAFPTSHGLVNERYLVQKWDHLWTNPDGNWKQLSVLKPALYYAQSRIWYVTHEPFIGPDGKLNQRASKEAWTTSHRDWRSNQLWSRRHAFDKKFPAKKGK